MEVEVVLLQVSDWARVNKEISTMEMIIKITTSSVLVEGSSNYL